MSNTNVGSVQISIDIDVSSNLERQIESVTENVASRLKSSIEKSTAKSDLSKSIGKSLSSVTNKSFEIGSKIGNKIASGIKKATNKALEQKNVANAVNNASNLATPKIKSGVGIADLTNQRDSSISMQENLNAQIYELQKQLSNATDMQRKGVVTEEMLKLENRIISLKSKSDNLTVSIRNLDSAIDNFDAEQPANGTNRLANATNKLNNSLKNVEKTSKRAKKPLVNFGSVGRSLVRQFIGISLLIRLVGQAVRKFFQSFVAGLKTNKEFSKSLDQIKSNLATAFQPIFEAVLPAINALMSGIARVTAYLATFISMLFGKSVKASNANAKALDNAKKSAEGYGKAMNKVAGFDQLNDMTEDSGGGGGASVGDISINDAEVGKLEGIFARLFDKIQPFIDIIQNLDFSPLSKSFENLWSATKPIIGMLGDAIAWFLNKILGPLIKWVTEKFAPTAINVIAGALKILGPILSAVGTAALFFWDNFLQPIASWTGGIIIGVLETLSKLLSSLGDWMKENQTLIDNIAIVVASFATAWGLVNGALMVWNGAIAIWNSIGAVATTVTTAFGTAVAFLTSPIGIVIVAIGSIIAIIALLIKNWDTVKEVAIKVWDGIKKAWNKAGEWFNNTVVKPIGDFFNGLWEGVKNAAANAWTWILNLFSKGGKIFNGVTEGIVSAFKSVVNAIIGGLNKVIAVPFNAINGVLNKIRNIDIPLVGKPFKGLWGENPMPVPKIPTLASGGVLDKPTLNLAGEYPGARSNPEIVTPQNIMAETFRSVMKEFVDAFKSGTEVSGQTMQLVINIGGKNLLDTIIELSKEYTRQTGKELMFNV